MEKLRKFGIWCWDSKEKVVLTLMVLLLGFRVYYLVMNNPEIEGKVAAKPPNPNVEVPVQLPPRIPPTLVPPPLTLLLRNPPFIWKRVSGSTTDPNGPNSADKNKLRLLRIIPDGSGGYKAQISTGASKKLFAEDEPFESYTLMNIDKDNGCVEIYSENTASTFELCIE